MRLISYSINIDEFQDGKQSPVMKYSGVYPSEAFKSPRELLQSIAEFLNEEFDLHLVVSTDEDLSDLSIDAYGENIFAPDASRKARIENNKKELGYE